MFKKKKLFSIFLFFPFSFLHACSSNANHQTIKKIENKNNITISESKINNIENWNLFLERDYIQNILNRIFKDNQDQKNEYIKSQMELGDDYLNEIKQWIRYSNNIVATYDQSDLSLFSDSSENKNFVSQTGSKIIEDLYNKNWLFFLFNLEKFIFIEYLALSALDQANDSLVDQIDSNKKIYNVFYKPKSNKIIDFVVQNFDDEVIEIKKEQQKSGDSLENVSTQNKKDENENNILSENNNINENNILNDISDDKNLLSNSNLFDFKNKKIVDLNKEKIESLTGDKKLKAEDIEKQIEQLREQIKLKPNEKDQIEDKIADLYEQLDNLDESNQSEEDEEESTSDLENSSTTTTTFNNIRTNFQNNISVLENKNRILEDRIFLLTEDGRILRLDITTNTLKNNVTANLHTYLYSYPKLISSKDKLTDFDLKKYVEVIAEWNDEELKLSENKKLLYSNEYGDKNFSYTLINVKI